MLLPAIKRFVLAIFIFVLSSNLKAQQTHFVYLQTENGQPFYVKMNNKVVSSSPAGYLILPKLADGNYKLAVGFPKKEFPEEDFQVAVDKKNLGYLLKNFGEKGWGLFNIQSYGVVMGGNTDTISSPAKNLQDDSFSRMLANVVKDSSILQKNEPVKEPSKVPEKPDSAVAKVDSAKVNPLISKASPDVARSDSAPSKSDVPTVKVDSVAKSTVPTIKTDSAVTKVDSAITVAENKQPQLLSPASRFFSKKNKDGREMIYVDHDQEKNDTIRIFIPTVKPVVKASSVDTTIVQNSQPLVKPSTDSATTSPEQAKEIKPDTVAVTTQVEKNISEPADTVAKKVEEKQPEIKKDSVPTPVNKTEVAKKDDMVVLPKVVESSANNSDCKAFAANEDFLKLRKKMAAENTDDNMIKIAKKIFHAKCFSTEQIKNLSFLFLTNEGKYRFFDMAYPFAADSDQYNTLQSQLTDSYYSNRFKAMIHK